MPYQARKQKFAMRVVAILGAKPAVNGAPSARKFYIFLQK